MPFGPFFWWDKPFEGHSQMLTKKTFLGRDFNNLNLSKGGSWAPDGTLDWKIGKLKKFIITTPVYDMLTEKDHYNELNIIHIHHNYFYSSRSWLLVELLSKIPENKFIKSFSLGRFLLVNHCCRGCIKSNCRGYRGRAQGNDGVKGSWDGIRTAVSNRTIGQAGRTDDGRRQWRCFTWKYA